jgi:peptidoglycan/xylan/chitin deacetylase (PgdA/CDA1 family)
LTWSEVGRLVREAGCQVGSHTHTHPVLTALAEDRAREELRTSRAVIEERLRMAPTTFAYPYGSYGTFSARTRRLLVEEGFSIACLTLWGRHRANDDPLGVKRLRVSWCDTPLELQKSLAGCYDWYRLVQYRQGALSGNRLTGYSKNSNISWNFITS